MFFIKILDNNPKLNVQYHSDTDVRESCLELAVIISYFYVRHGVQNPSLYVKPYSTPKYGTWLDYRDNYDFTANLFAEFLDEYLFRFDKEHICKSMQKLFQELYKEVEFTKNQGPDLMVGLPEKDYLDDNQKPFKAKYHIDGLTGSKKPINKVSLVNSHRAWYKELIIRDNATFTKRDWPVFAQENDLIARPRRAEF